MTTAPPAPGPAEHIAATLRGVGAQAAGNRPAGIVVSALLALLTELFILLADLVERIKAGECQPGPPTASPSPAPSAQPLRAPATTQAARKTRPAAPGDACGERSFRAAEHPAPGPEDGGPDGSRPDLGTKNTPPDRRAALLPPAVRKDCQAPSPKREKLRDKRPHWHVLFVTISER
jgi:hypothetical protein